MTTEKLTEEKDLQNRIYYLEMHQREINRLNLEVTNDTFAAMSEFVDIGEYKTKLEIAINELKLKFEAL